MGLCADHVRNLLFFSNTFPDLVNTISKKEIIIIIIIIKGWGFL